MVHGSLIEWTQLITHQSTDRSGYKKWKGLVKMSRKISQRKQVSFADRIANCRNSTSHLSISQYQQTMKHVLNDGVFSTSLKIKPLDFEAKKIHIWPQWTWVADSIGPWACEEKLAGLEAWRISGRAKASKPSSAIKWLNVVVLYTWNTWMFYEHHHLKNAAIFVYASVTYLSVSFTVWAWLSIPNCFRYI